MAKPNRWHINDKGEVNPCTAQRGNCRFGGATGSEDHFTSRAVAEDAAAKKNGFATLDARRKVIEIGIAKPETKAAVEKLAERGVSVSASKTLDDLSSPPTRSSEVNILEESLPAITLEAIRKNRPF